MALTALFMSAGKSGMLPNGRQPTRLGEEAHGVPDHASITKTLVGLQAKIPERIEKPC